MFNFDCLNVNHFENTLISEELVEGLVGSFQQVWRQRQRGEMLPSFTNHEKTISHGETSEAFRVLWRYQRHDFIGYDLAPPPRDGDHFPNFSDKLDSMLKYTFEKRKHTTGFRSEPRYGIFTSWPINSYVRNEMRVSIRPLIRHLYVYGNLSSCSLKSTLFSYGISSVPKIKRRGRKKLFPP